MSNASSNSAIISFSETISAVFLICIALICTNLSRCIITKDLNMDSSVASPSNSSQHSDTWSILELFTATSNQKTFFLNVKIKVVSWSPTSAAAASKMKLYIPIFRVDSTAPQISFLAYFLILSRLICGVLDVLWLNSTPASHCSQELMRKSSYNW